MARARPFYSTEDDDGPSLGAQVLHAVTAPVQPLGFRAAAARQAAAAPLRPAPAAAASRGGEEEDLAEDGDDDDEEDEEEAEAEGGEPGAAPQRAGAKRSRHAPAEQPSTRAVSRHRQVLAVPVAVRRDPRYEASAGTLKEDLVAKSYAFLDARRKEELEALQRDAKRAAAQDPERAREIKAEVARRKQAAAEALRVTALKASQRALKKGAQAAVAGGARPYFPKQRELKEFEAVERFKALEAAGGASAVEKALKKRRVTLAKKDRTRLPQRGGRGEGEF